MFDEYSERDLAARSGDERFFQAPQITSNQRKKVGWLWKRIMPFGLVPTVVQLAGGTRVAV
jgi:hypothetical protein